MVSRDLYLPPAIDRLVRYAVARVPQKPGKHRLEQRRQKMIAALAPEVAKEEAAKLQKWRERE